MRRIRRSTDAPGPPLRHPEPVGAARWFDRQRSVSETALLVYGLREKSAMNAKKFVGWIGVGVAAALLGLGAGISGAITAKQ
jgi:hypothetical protein